MEKWRDPFTASIDAEEFKLYAEEAWTDTDPAEIKAKWHSWIKGV